MKVLDLFSGIGGFSLGLERAGMTTVAFCERDPFCRTVLATHWPGVRIYDDVRSLDAGRLAADGIHADLVCGGFPCQAHSTASRGRRVAEDLWPEMLRIIEDVRPAAVLAENVPGLSLVGVDRICGDLELAGYAVWPYRLDTAPAGRHRARDRFVFVAYADRQGEPRRPVHAEVAGLRRVSERGAADVPAPVGVDDGLPHRMDRLRALGNAKTPDDVEAIGRALLAYEAHVSTIAREEAA